MKPLTALKARVQGNVTFAYYQDGSLFYRCDDDFTFPVPVTDCGSARFPAVEKGMLFMRWIRQHMQLIEALGNVSSES
jgi:hypothetical protein